MFKNHCAVACSSQGASCQSEESAPITTILEAVCKSNADRLRELIAEGKDVNGCDRFSLSYLHMAAGVGDREIIEILIGAGVPVNQKCGRKQSTPAHSAVRFGQLSSLQTLVENKADLTITDMDGKTPGQIAEENKNQDILGYLAYEEERIALLKIEVLE